MTLVEYLKFVAQRIHEAEEKGDKQEVLRLCGLLITTLQETIEKQS